MKLTTSSIRTELETVRLRHGGKLSAAAVVAAARDPDTALHARFCWDDGEAARLYRLEQAKYLIRLVVTVLPQAPNMHTRLYVSLSDERGDTEYRHVLDVLSDAGLRARQLRDALAELGSFQRKYQHLEELSAIFEALSHVRPAQGGKHNGSHRKRTQKAARGTGRGARR